MAMKPISYARHRFHLTLFGTPSDYLRFTLGYRDVEDTSVSMALSPLTITSGNKDKDPSFSARQSRDEHEIPVVCSWRFSEAEPAGIKDCFQFEIRPIRGPQIAETTPSPSPD